MLNAWKYRKLFSAHAEVFPSPPHSHLKGTPLLRARGGISTAFQVDHLHPRSSPRTRRYFLWYEES